tara:strand:+ start:520 stop:942 length:423 start_codon:yes stop_codon:yes gene_type:complete
MAINITTRPPTSFNVKTAPAGVVSGAGATAQASTPSNPGAGDLWFDTGQDTLKVYDGSEWDSLGLVDLDNDGRFEFDSTDTASNPLADGLIASFKNDGTDVFTISFDGILDLKAPSSVPTAFAGGVYHDGEFLFIGSDPD